MQILRNGQSPETFLSQYKISSFSLCQDYLKIICVLYSWQICNRKEWLPFPFLARQLHTASYTHLYTILYCTVLYYTILYYTILYYTILYYTILYYTVLYCTILYYSMLSYALLYYTILFYAILCFAVLYSYYILWYTDTILILLFSRCCGDSECLTLNLPERGNLLQYSAAWVLQYSIMTYQEHSYLFFFHCNSLLVSLNNTTLNILRKRDSWRVNFRYKTLPFLCFLPHLLLNWVRDQVLTVKPTNGA